MEKENTVQSDGQDWVNDVVELFGNDADPKEIELAKLVTEIYCDTELPSRFEVVHTTSVTNNTVEEKSIRLFGISELEGRIIPKILLFDYPVKFDDETKEKAPWVNMIHAWNKVLNELNTVSAMQREDIDISPIILASVGHSLYKFTTDADKDPFIRSNDSFRKGAKYVETIKRESGTKGANSQRHVCSEEMKYILETVKECYTK